MEQAKQEKLKKALTIVGNILIYVFCAISLFMLFVTIFSKRNVDGAVNVFGYEMRIVLTGSMEKGDTDVSKFKVKNIKAGSMVFVQTLPEDESKWDEWYGSLKEGDVLTFRYVPADGIRQETITHRIKDIQPKEGGGYIITLKGDAVKDDTQVIDTTEYATGFNFVLGKVVGKSFLFGKFVTTLKTPLGMSLIIIVPCAIIIILQVIKIVNVLNANKRKKAEEIAQQRLDEMEELKRRLAELESNKSSDDASPTAELNSLDDGSNS